jgi:signal transduction histidine kinase
MSQRLYLRIWLAVVSALVVLTLVAGWLWRMDLERERAERPLREIVLYNAQGEVLGQAPARPMRAPGNGPLEFRVTLRDGQTVVVQMPRHRRPPGVPGGPGAPEPSWWRPQSVGFVGMLAFFAVAVALGTYPVVRWLTQRLERLQQGVERWGEGDLSARLPVQGDDEVAFLARRFNAAAERVQGLGNSHKALLANASHELRSPLARIRMGLELLDGADPARTAAQRAEMARNIAELDQLIDEILLASRLDAVQGVNLQLEDIDLTGLAAEECARTGAQLHIEAQPMLVGDARLLRRVLRNLLENARRHAQQAGAGTPVDLTLQSDGGVARVVVDDRGPGVPLAERERIFEAFYRLPGASERDGGVGLGLSLVKTIVTAHGGRVWCEGRQGPGARFVVELPQTPRA